MKIIDIKSRQILDSRGFPTIETDVNNEEDLKTLEKIAYVCK